MQPELNNNRVDRVLDGKVAVVAGGTSGIGARIGQLFAVHGATVVIAGRRQQRGAQLASEIGTNARFRLADVRVEHDVQDLFSFVDDEFGRLDCLVNSAGDIGSPDGVSAIKMDQFWRTMDLHVGGVIRGMKYATPLMMRQGCGSIVNVASIAGQTAGWTGLDYSTAKAAVIQATRCAAIELADNLVRVNSLSPGPILTGIFGKGAGIDHDAADRGADMLEKVFESRLKAWQPVPRAGRTTDVASVAVWLASDASAFVTGQNIVVDGGISAGRPARVSAEDSVAMADILTQNDFRE
jgi:NAD(P)-dependent dehydrogenase (short-subunit alcohol dehydrogenase family)